MGDSRSFGRGSTPRSATYLRGYMGTILGFFVFGAIGWYIVMLLFAIWTFFIIEKNDLTLGIIELILCLIFVQFMGKTNILGYIFNNPVLVLLEIVSYFVIGFF